MLSRGTRSGMGSAWTDLTGHTSCNTVLILRGRPLSPGPESSCPPGDLHDLCAVSPSTAAKQMLPGSAGLMCLAVLPASQDARILPCKLLVITIFQKFCLELPLSFCQQTVWRGPRQATRGRDRPSNRTLTPCHCPISVKPT